MNSFFKIFTGLVFLFSLTSYAQFHNNRSASGLDRNVGSQNRYKNSQKEPIDYAKVMSENLTEKLKLDAFQSSVVKNLIKDFLKESADISQENIPQDAKIEKTNIARATMETKFAAIFSDEQKVLFEELMTANKSQNNKKKKKKKDSSDSDEN